MGEMRHIPVLLEEVMRWLAPHPGQVYADCTTGLGGHAARVRDAVSPGGTLVLNDVDPGNLAHAKASLGDRGDVRVVVIRSNFASLPREMARAGIKADMVLADLGFASSQMDDAARGLSFMREGPLDMRLDPSLPITAGDLIASASEAELERIIREFGEDPMARRIARKIVRERDAGPISTTARLAEVVRSACASPNRGAGSGGIHPATRTFQALRIAVNDELGCLDALLHAVTVDAKSIAAGQSGMWLAEGARVGFITFHSLEDRPVKRAFRGLVDAGAARDVTDGALVPTQAEIEANPRARSAKLRVIALGGRGG
ncbi:MAG: 16S rRNA (cytosine(1402)-N(4))-methyltransferase RsmH [Phycisphaerales bacterium]|nr:16S rRNA (cytosine(1402)-N(4))-methyltransferase RsmH [Phycisphaerales bacterium]